MFNVIISLLVACILSIFSTVVMSYIAMATPIGPWIGPTLVLSAMILFRSINKNLYSVTNLTLATCAGTVGGILATAIGFSFPTLYFLDRSLFNSWVGNSLSFVSFLSLFSVLSGGLGIAIANILEKKLIVKEQLPFPIGKLIYKMISSQNQAYKAYELMLGFVSSFVFSLLRTGVKGAGLIPTEITLLNKRSIGIFSVPLIKLDLSIWPMLLAIGFVTGHVIAIPLLVGAFSKIVVLDPINTIVFKQISSAEFVLAFCSGMVLSSTIFGFIKLPATIYKALKNVKTNVVTVNYLEHVNRFHIIEIAFWLFSLIIFFSYYKFSWLAIIFMLLATIICAYEILYIAGEIGLAPLGRFATFVMVPAMLLFGLDAVQIVIVATFVEIVGGVACDILFGRKIAQLAHVDHKKIERFQYFGLLISSLSIGIVFWLLIRSLGLGSDALFAYKAQSRQLLIQAKEFNYIVLLCGFIYGQLLSYIRINPMLVLGGLLMPLNISLGLIIGGLAAMWIKDKEELYPFWSGMFAANSLWMLMRAII